MLSTYAAWTEGATEADIATMPTLHVHVAMPCARLASGGWLTSTGWESNPMDSIEEFPLLT